MKTMKRATGRSRSRNSYVYCVLVLLARKLRVLAVTRGNPSLEEK
jgi:hypothetical protein